MFTILYYKKTVLCISHKLRKDVRYEYENQKLDLIKRHIFMEETSEWKEITSIHGQTISILVDDQNNQLNT